jgi:hypothetical protein
MDNPARKRTLAGLYLAIGAVALGLIAQGYFKRAATPTDGLIVYALAVALFGVAAAKTPLLPARMPQYMPAPAHRHSWPERDVLRFTWSAGFLLLACAATVASLAFFERDTQPSLRWMLYLLAILLFVVAVYGLPPALSGGRAKEQRKQVPGTSEVRGTLKGVTVVVALIVILAIGAFFRFYRFMDLPYGVWYDEADNGLWVRQILSNPDYRPVYVTSTNLPAHFLYLVALSFRIFGDSVHAIRAVAAVFGMLTIVAAFACGRELGGRYFGLALAFLLAVSRWDVNWSRIGMHGVTVPFFELWLVAALLRGLRTGKLAAFAWAGIALGSGLCFYSPFRVFPAVLAGFLLAWGLEWLASLGRQHLDWPARRLLLHAWQTWAIPGLLFAVGTLVVVAPVAQFAVQHPDVFWDRAKRVSIWTAPEVQSSPATAILESTAKHLLMFNYRGDPNGRHNLPGEPMLDRLGGVLFVLGTVMCVLGWRDPRAVLLLLWLFVSLSGGILSTWFEAPQSLRSIGALPAACALICMAMAWFADEWRRIFSGAHAARRLVPVGLLVLLAIGLENGVTYFYFRARDFASWAAFNAAETHLAQDINTYRDRYVLRFDPLLTAHLTTRYMAPDYEVYHHFDPATVFPIHESGSEGVLLFVSPDSVYVRQQARLLYPTVREEVFAHPESGNVVMYKLFFDRETIEGVQGLDALYVATGAQAQDGQHLRGSERQLDLAWGDGPPVPYPFDATWIGALLVPEYGAYMLALDTPHECLLELDGRPVAGGQDGQIMVARGEHILYVGCKVGGPGPVRLMWTTPADRTLRPVPGDLLYRSFWPVRGLLGRFYQNADWSGDPVTVRIDRQIGYYFHFLPLSRPYTVEWSGQLAVPLSGAYRIGVNAVSSASLYLDGAPLLEQTLAGQLDLADVALGAGMHDIRLRFLDDQPRSQVYLYWQPPDGDVALIPFDMLFLPEEGVWWPK